MRLISALCAVLAAFSVSADYRYEFSNEKNPLEKLVAAPFCLRQIGDKITWANGVLKSSSTNLLLYAPEEVTDGRVTLRARDCYQSTITLVARANKEFNSYYALEVSSSQKKAFFYRTIYGEPTKKQEIPYGGEREFTLMLDFDGKTVTGWINGSKAGEMPDDGRLKSGMAGIRGGFWTNAELKSLEYSAAIAKAETVAEQKTPGKTTADASDTGFRYEFTTEVNPLRELSIASTSLPLVGSKINWADGVLKSSDCHLILYAPKEFSRGRVSLKARDRYESTIALIARANKDFSAFYALEVCPSLKKASFYRFIYGEPTKRQELPYGGGREFTLTLDFDGKTIVARINGRKVHEIPDDGRLKSGMAGIRGGFWTNAELKNFEYSAAIPEEETQALNQPPMKPAANVKKLDLKKIRDWDLAKAYRTANGTRLTVSLNQVWRFRPVSDQRIPALAPESEWGYFVVPGYWAKGAINNYMRTDDGTAVTEWRGIPFTKKWCNIMV